MRGMFFKKKSMPQAMLSCTKHETIAQQCSLSSMCSIDSKCGRRLLNRLRHSQRNLKLFALIFCLFVSTTVADLNQSPVSIYADTITSSPSDDVTYSSEHCQFETFNATCRHGYAILMSSARYGRHRIGRCVRRSYGVLGCTADVLAEVDWRCSGRRTCRMNVADIGLQGIQPCPDEFSSYLETAYKCVPVDDATYPACVGLQKHRLTTNSRRVGFISNVYHQGMSTSSSSNPDRDVMRKSRDRHLMLFGDASMTSPCGFLLQGEPGYRFQVTLYFFRPSTNEALGSFGSHQSAADLPKDHSVNHASFFTNNDDVTKDSGLCRRLSIIRDGVSGRETTVCTSAGGSSILGGALGGRAKGSATSDRVRNVFTTDGHILEVLIVSNRKTTESLVSGNHQVDSAVTGSDEFDESPHFMLRYEAVGCATPTFSGMHVAMTSYDKSEVTCNATREHWTLTCVETSWTGTVGDCSPIVQIRSPPEDNDLEGSDIWSTWTNRWKSSRDVTKVIGLGIVLGVIIGLLLLAISAFLIHVRCARRNVHRRQQRYTSTPAAVPTRDTCLPADQDLTDDCSNHDVTGENNAHWLYSTTSEHYKTSLEANYTRDILRLREQQVRLSSLESSSCERQTTGSSKSPYLHSLEGATEPTSIVDCPHHLYDYATDMKRQGLTPPTGRVQSYDVMTDRSQRPSKRTIFADTLGDYSHVELGALANFNPDTGKRETSIPKGPLSGISHPITSTAIAKETRQVGVTETSHEVMASGEVTLSCGSRCVWSPPPYYYYYASKEVEKSESGS